MLYLTAKSFQSPTTIAGQVESERSISVPRIFNHHYYPLKFQRCLCWYIRIELEPTTECAEIRSTKDPLDVSYKTISSGASYETCL
jgi:hypothetical protein